MRHCEERSEEAICIFAITPAQSGTSIPRNDGDGKLFGISY